MQRLQTCERYSDHFQIHKNIFLSNN
jgi:hypothetical protein